MIHTKTRKIKKQLKCFNCGKPFIGVGNNDCYCEDCRPACRKKDDEDIKNMTDEAAALLLEAMLEKAKKDYIRDIMKWKNANTEKEIRSAWHTIKAWHKWWVNELTNLTIGIIDGKEAFRSINREIYGKEK